jgi:predicted DNA binding CopG/RHH family protein
MCEQSMHGGKMTDGKDARLTIRLPRELLEAAREKAQHVDIPVSQYLRHCLRAWVEEELSQASEKED